VVSKGKKKKREKTERKRNKEAEKRTKHKKEEKLDSKRIQRAVSVKSAQSYLYALLGRLAIENLG